MNIQQAKSIPLPQIIEKMGQSPVRTSLAKIKYFSPYRAERTPSFFVFIRENRWHDFGDGRGGDIIDLVRLYLEAQGVTSSVSAALRWMGNMVSFPRITPVQVQDHIPSDKSLILKSIGAITERGLLHYAQSRGLSQPITRKYFKQARVTNNLTAKSFYALAMENETNGYELRNAFIKGCVKTKDVTVIRGNVEIPSVVHVFEGMMDFASIMEQRKGRLFKGDVVILHSLNCLDIGSSFIRNYSYRLCCTWMDNDLAGKRATKSWGDFCLTQDKLTHVPMNKLYKPHKDVNAAHMAKLGLK